MHAKYEVSISYGSKVIAKVKVDDRQDKNNMTPIIRSGGIKIQSMTRTKKTGQRQIQQQDKFRKRAKQVCESNPCLLKSKP